MATLSQWVAGARPRTLPAASAGSSKPGRWPPQRSVTTGFPDRVSKVRGVTKRVAAGVITTMTAAPRRVSSRTSSQAL